MPVAIRPLALDTIAVLQVEPIGQCSIWRALKSWAISTVVPATAIDAT